MSMIDDNKSLRTLEAFEARLTLSEERLAQSEDELKRAKAHLRTIWSVALVGLFGAFGLGLSPQAQAQYGVTIASLDARLRNASGALSTLSNKTKFMSVSGTTTQFTGTNIQIVSGGGSTDASVNGLGNLIIGYNESRSSIGGADIRIGSHNLILGNNHNFSSYGGLIVGQFNSVSAPYASISGGYINTITSSGSYASITGGRENSASGLYASISGGGANRTQANLASVSGGAVNTASGNYASISGGQFNTASGNSSISGGQNLTTTIQHSWKAGNLSFP